MKVDWKTFSERYCRTQATTPDELATVLRERMDRFAPVGFMMAEARDMSSSWLGSVTVLPYGPNNSYVKVPPHPFSPRGLASDTSTVIMTLDACDVPKELKNKTGGESR